MNKAALNAAADVPADGPQGAQFAQAKEAAIDIVDSGVLVGIVGIVLSGHNDNPGSAAYVSATVIGLAP